MILYTRVIQLSLSKYGENETMLTNGSLIQWSWEAEIKNHIKENQDEIKWRLTNFFSELLSSSVCYLTVFLIFILVFRFVVRFSNRFSALLKLHAIVSLLLYFTVYKWFFVHILRCKILFIVIAKIIWSR